ncbi:MAG: hypothetical protein E5V49_18345 [Mesorhizobium sp.]|nr:MAG: hypothetical protein E5V48_14485 [Mesorhizobium sp.]TJW30975.1 MAG: hypothetical protein E5V49_18345 [Mesorhizobium sp.]
MVLGHSAPRDATDGDQGVGAHKDGGFLMPLLQCDRTVAAQAIYMLDPSETWPTRTQGQAAHRPHFAAQITIRSSAFLCLSRRRRGHHAVPHRTRPILGQESRRIAGKTVRRRPCVGRGATPGGDHSGIAAADDDDDDGTFSQGSSIRIVVSDPLRTPFDCRTRHALTGSILRVFAHMFMVATMEIASEAAPIRKH